MLASSGAGCLLWGLRSSSLHADETPRDAPPVPGAVEECPACSDVRVMAPPREQIRVLARPIIGMRGRIPRTGILRPLKFVEVERVNEKNMGEDIQLLS